MSWQHNPAQRDREKAMVASLQNIERLLCQINKSIELLAAKTVNKPARSESVAAGDETLSTGDSLRCD